MNVTEAAQELRTTLTDLIGDFDFEGAIESILDQVAQDAVETVKDQVTFAQGQVEAALDYLDEAERAIFNARSELEEANSSLRDAEGSF